MVSQFAGAWSQVPQQAVTSQTRFTVLGAGLAGAHVAWQLARRGHAVRVLERRVESASETSAHPGFVLFPMLSMGFEPMAQIYHAAYERALVHIDEMQRLGLEIGWHPTGVVHLAVKQRLRNIWERFEDCVWHHERIRRLIAAEAGEQLGREVKSDAFAYPYSGWFDPREWVRALLSHEQITLDLGVAVERIARVGDCWVLYDDEGKVVGEADVLVLANAADVVRFEPTAWLPILRNRGQLAYVEASRWQAPKQVFCHEGYFIPNCGDHHLLGATFDLCDETTELREADQQQLLTAVHKLFPDFPIKDMPLNGRVAWRAQTYDRLPVVGPVATRQAFEAQYQSYYQERKRREFATAPCEPGLWVTSGHAARGSVSCTLAGELLAAQITGGKAPIDEELQAYLNPNRFLIRGLK